MRLRLGLLATLAVAAFPATAAAEPAFTATISGDTPTFNWEGAGNGISDPFGFGVYGCGDPGHDCQDILLNVTEAGDLNFDIQSDGDVTVAEPTGEFGDIITFQDIDAYLYPSDATGEIKGESLSEESATTKGDETFTMPGIQPGYYLLQLEVFLGYEASWVGKAELTGFAPRAAAPVVPTPAAADPGAPAPTAAPAPAESQPAAQPAPEKKAAPKKSSKKVSKKAACKKKAKKIKNKGKRKKALKKCAKLKK